MKWLVDFLNTSFQRHLVIYWGNMSRTNNLMIILNISLFFLTELVTTGVYYYTYYSLVLVVFVKVGLLIPIGLINRLWYYCIFLFAQIIAAYYLIASIIFWVKNA